MAGGKVRLVSYCRLAAVITLFAAVLLGVPEMFVVIAQVMLLTPLPPSFWRFWTYRLTCWQTMNAALGPVIRAERLFGLSASFTSIWV